LVVGALANEPLRQFGRLRTRDVDEAEAVVTKVYVPHRLRPVDGKAIDARLNAVNSGAVTFGFLTYGATSRISLPPMETCYHVNITLAGSSTVSCAEERGRTVGMSGAAVLTPDRAHLIEWAADAQQIALKIPRGDLEGHLTSLTHVAQDRPIDFDLTADLRSPAGRGLLRAIDFVQREWDEDGVLTAHPASRRHLESLVLTSLLVAAPGAHQRVLARDEGPLRSDPLRTATAYVHDHLDELPTLEDLTRVTGVGARALQAAFRRHLQCTPLQYVRDARLMRARTDLLHPGTDRQSVTDVAARWGFYNVGRFSALYRARFGEAPSVTLARALHA
jgi:AraC-like DNA-binding protein